MIDLSKIDPWTEEEAEELFMTTNPVTVQEVITALRALEPTDPFAANVLLTYIMQQKALLLRAREEKNRYSHLYALERDPRHGNY